jgi:hypothetical protein
MITRSGPRAKAAGGCTARSPMLARCVPHGAFGDTDANFRERGWDIPIVPGEVVAGEPPGASVP